MRSEVTCISILIVYAYFMSDGPSNDGGSADGVGGSRAATPVISTGASSLHASNGGGSSSAHVASASSARTTDPVLREKRDNDAAFKEAAKQRMKGPRVKKSKVSAKLEHVRQEVHAAQSVFIDRDDRRIVIGNHVARSC